MPRSIIPSFLRSPAELRRQLDAVTAERDQARDRVMELEEKNFRYAEALVRTRTELVGVKAVLASRGIRVPEPRRKRLTLVRPRGAEQ